MRALALVIVVAACRFDPAPVPIDSDAREAMPVPDAGAHSFDWTVAVSPLDDTVITRIDGVESDYLRRTFPDDTDSPPARLLETVVHGRVVSSQWARPLCDQTCGDAIYVAKKEHWFAYPSGELRMVATTCDSTVTECLVKDSAEPLCHRGTCTGGERCGIDRVDDDPSLGWLACVPTGVVAAGGACTIDAHGIDDCGADLHCVDGTCHGACEFVEDLGVWKDLGQCGEGVACARVPATSPEVGVCP